MSKSFCASRPSFSASRKASQTTIIDAPRIMLLQIFAAWPLPAPPACTIVLPIFSSTGRARRHRPRPAARHRRVDHRKPLLFRGLRHLARGLDVDGRGIDEQRTALNRGQDAVTAEIGLAHL